jgi:ABC-2 type transport system permease protein
MSADRVTELRSNLRAEWGKVWSVRGPSLWLVGALLMCLVTAWSLANDFVHSISTGEQPPGAQLPVIDALGPAVTFAQVAVVGFAMHLVTPEYASGSIGPTFLSQPRRWVVVAAKALTAAGVAAVVGLAVGALTAWGIELVLGDALGARIGLAPAGVGTAVVFGCAAIVGVGLAFVLRSAVGALSTGFLLLIVTLAAPGPVDHWLPGPAQASWLTDLTSSEVSARPIAVLLAWTSVVLVTSVWLARRRDA